MSSYLPPCRCQLRTLVLTCPNTSVSSIYFFSFGYIIDCSGPIYQKQHMFGKKRYWGRFNALALIQIPYQDHGCLYQPQLMYVLQFGTYSTHASAFALIDLRLCSHNYWNCLFIMLCVLLLRRALIENAQKKDDGIFSKLFYFKERIKKVSVWKRLWHEWI